MPDNKVAPARVGARTRGKGGKLSSAEPTPVQTEPQVLWWHWSPIRPDQYFVTRPATAPTMRIERRPDLGTESIWTIDVYDHVDEHGKPQPPIARLWTYPRRPHGEGWVKVRSETTDHGPGVTLWERSIPADGVVVDDEKEK